MFILTPNVSGVSVVRLTWSDEKVMTACTVQVRMGIILYTKEFFGDSNIGLEDIYVACYGTGEWG
jgi:hypothetical protein